MPYPALSFSTPCPAIFELWDRLADFPAADTEQALCTMLDGLCKLTNAQNAYWLGAVRVSDSAPEDQLNGWRPRAMRYLHNHAENMAIYRQKSRELERGQHEPSSVAQTREAGWFRVARNSDISPPEWFESEYYRRMYTDKQINDILFVTIPVNEDCEAYIALIRMQRPGKPFTPDDMAMAATVLRGLKWLQRRIFLSFGLLISEMPLAPSERRVFSQMLTAASEKQIADRLGLTRATTHTYIRQIYRKLGIKSRAELNAIWLGDQ